MNNDLISREALIKAVEDLYEYAELGEVLDVIKEAPAVELTETEIQEVLNKRCMSAVANDYLIALHGKRPRGEWVEDDEPKTSRQERALEIIDALKDDRLIGNKQRGILRRAILDNTPEVPDNMTLIPTAVLDDLTKTTRELGEWKIDGALIACDVCGRILLKASKLYKYCPNCGARMTKEGGKR